MVLQTFRTDSDSMPQRTLVLPEGSVAIRPQQLASGWSSLARTDLAPFDMESAATARIVFAAFQQGYPSKITDYGYDRELGDWFIQVGQRKFLWAKGRILPQEEALRPDRWRPVVDYIYPSGLIAPQAFSRKLVREIRRISQADFRAIQPPYHLDFFDALYDGKHRDKMEDNILSITFLDRKVSVHRDIVDVLSMVETKILAVAEKNQEVQDFVGGIASVGGYNWREIRGRQDRSFHSWGLALDIMPRGWQEKNVYWSWVNDSNPDWMMIPLENRWMPPAPVVEIFEEHGFVWGGKWMLWDTIHFEYRPELLILMGR